jgi:hypothetical protein
VHTAVDTPGHLLAFDVTAASQQDCARVGALAEAALGSRASKQNLPERHDFAHRLGTINSWPQP